MGEHGFLDVHLPAEYGGGGAGIHELAIVCEELAAQGCPLLLMVVSAAICAELIARFGTPEQRQAWLPAMAAGRKMAFAITEPDAGSNTHRISTTARRDGDIYRVLGSKTFISGVDEVEQVLVVTRTAVDEKSGNALLTLLIVDTGSPGLTRSPIAVETRRQRSNSCCSSTRCRCRSRDISATSTMVCAWSSLLTVYSLNVVSDRVRRQLGGRNRA